MKRKVLKLTPSSDLAESSPIGHDNETHHNFVKDLDYAAERIAIGQEIETLHKPSIQWANLNGVLYDYANPTKKSTLKLGRFDFLFMRGKFGCWVEYKALHNPRAGLSDKQKDWEAWAIRCGLSTLVTNSFLEARTFIVRELALTL